MSEALITTLIGFAGTIITVILTNSKTVSVLQEQIKNTRQTQETTKEELRRDISELSERVSKHNNLVERMAVVEQSAKSAHRRLDEMKL